MDLTKNDWSSASETTRLLIDENGAARAKSRHLGTRARLLLALAILLLVILAIVVGLLLGLLLNAKRSDPHTQNYKHAAVATDAGPCSDIGADLLRDGGSAVDAAVGSLLCVGVVNLQSTGIGGGGFMLVYNATTEETIAFDFREKAPAIITNETMEKYINDSTSTLIGGLAVGVPGQLKGLYEAHRKHGKLPWSKVVQPSIDVAENGFVITEAVGDAIQSVQSRIDNESFTGLFNLLAPDGTFLKEGDTLKQPLLAKTLRSIANEGPDYFYKSNFTEEMVTELANKYDSILTVEDFNNYDVAIRNVLKSEYNDLKIHGMPPPASGAVLALVLKILEGFKFTFDDNTNPLTYHRIVEAFKFAYGQRLDLGDPDYNETINEVVEFMLNNETAETMRSLIDDNTTHEIDYYLMHMPKYNPISHGTSHLSIVDEKGNAVAVTSTINTYFGSLICSDTSGIIFNNEMDDFSVPGRDNAYGYPPSPSNYLSPSHRPLSSTTPTIVTRNGQVVMVAGASGGSRIISSTSQVLLDALSFSLTLSDSVSRPRLHHQLIPDYVVVEDDFPESFIEGLKERNHEVNKTRSLAVVQAIYRENDGSLTAASDRRKGGRPSGY